MVVSQLYPTSLSTSSDPYRPMKWEPHFWVTTAPEWKVEAWKSSFGGEVTGTSIICLSSVSTRLTINFSVAVLRYSE